MSVLSHRVRPFRGLGEGVLGFLVLVSTLLVLGSASANDPLFDRAKARYESAQSTKTSSLKERELKQAAREFKQVVDRHDPSKFRPESLFYLGKIHQDLSREPKDPTAAGRSLHYFRTLVREHQNHRLADDAWLEIAKLCSNVFSDERCAQEARQKVASLYGGKKVQARPVERKLARIGKAELANVSFKTEGKTERVILHLEGIPRHKAKFLPANPSQNKPARFFVDLDGITLSSDLVQPQPTPNTRIRAIRFGQFTKNVARVVLDLSEGVGEGDIQIQNDAGLAIVLGQDGKPSTSKDPIATVISDATPKAKPQVETKREVFDPPPPVRKPGKKRIVLDAGHGGHDPGARGPRGTKEKEICLKVTRRVEKLLRDKGKYEVFMTRTDDRYISLLDRTTFANEKNGDLFISIHANASPKRSARGVSTYFLDNADDEESLRVAMRENGELSIEQFNAQAQGDDYFLEVMKASMVKNFHTVQSTDLARHIQNMMMSDLSRRYSKVRDLGVRSAKFYVLTGATMPAVLVETSFISNSLEEKRLRSSTYQKRIAEAVVKGIENFFKSSVGKGDHTALFKP